MDLFLIIALVTMLAGGLIGLELVMGTGKIRHIEEVVPVFKDTPPKVSVIVPARDEALTIEPALRSVLALDYEQLEIVVVNDRSTDGTGHILEEMSHEFPKLKVINISELPDKWLGKNYALYRGAGQATGEYLLFTDADVFFEKSVLQRTIYHMQKTGLDHLSLIFGVPSVNGLLGMLMLEIAAGLFLLMRPWKVNEKSSRYYMGVGAFNLVKSYSYEKSGTHAAIAMCPVDDIMLGKLIKKHGFRQDCMYGQGLVTVNWYYSVPEMIKGLMKNIFAGFDYSLLKVFICTSGQLLFGVWPMLALVFISGPSRYVNSLIVISRLIFFAKTAHTVAMTGYQSLWTLVTPYLTIYMSWKAVIQTLRGRGITWRGTHYSLDDLKAGRI